MNSAAPKVLLTGQALSPILASVESIFGAFSDGIRQAHGVFQHLQTDVAKFKDMKSLPEEAREALAAMEGRLKAMQEPSVLLDELHGRLGGYILDILHVAQTADEQLAAAKAKQAPPAPKPEAEKPQAPPAPKPEAEKPQAPAPPPPPPPPAKEPEKDPKPEATKPAPEQPNTP